MSETAAYVMRGFYGTTSTINRWKGDLEEAGHVNMLPAAGLPADLVDVGGTQSMFAVAVAPDVVLTPPSSVKEARPERVAGLVGSTF